MSLARTLNSPVAGGALAFDHFAPRRSPLVTPCGRALTVGMLVLLAGLLSGCSDASRPSPRDAGVLDGRGDLLQTDGGACQLAVASINGRPAADTSNLTVEDDLDPDTAGIQIDIEVSSPQLVDNAIVTLDVTRLALDPTAAAQAGVASFDRVSIAATIDEVLIRATTPGCAQAELRLNVEPPPACFFVAPADQSGLAKANDKNPTTDAFEFDVRVGTRNVAGAGTIELRVGQRTIGSAALGANGEAAFADTVLDVADEVVLSGSLTVGDVVQNCRATISVTTTTPPCTISFSPEPTSGPNNRDGIGVVHDTRPTAPGMQANVRVDTGTLVDQVSLNINGQSRPPQAVSGGGETFTSVSLPEGEVALSALCVETNSGNQGTSPTFNLIVDSVAPEPISSLNCELDNHRTGTIRCNWTAISDRGTGVSSYQLRQSTSGPLTAENWEAATVAKTVVANVAGSVQIETFTGLALAQTYHFGLRALDGVENLSPVATPAQGLEVDFKSQIRQGTSTSSSWGRSVAAGDFNCDGNTDIAVGNPGASGGRGRVDIFLGNDLSVILARPEKSLVGTIVDSNFGAQLATLPNFDGANACDDLAVLASHANSNAAKVYVYLGRDVATGFPDREDVTAGRGAEMQIKLADNASADERLPLIASAGDFDNDGASDLALVHHQVGASDAAEIWVVYGDASLTPLNTGSSDTPAVRQVPQTAGVRIVGGKVSEAFGRALCGGSSLSRTEFDDLVVGLPGWQGQGSTRGAVLVATGAARAASLPETIPIGSSSRTALISGTSENAEFGGAVGIVGDMDGDGFPEFAAADAGSNGARGRVYVFNLSSGGAAADVSAAVLRIDNDDGNTDDRLGQSVACSARGNVDMNNDGLADILVSTRSSGTSTAGAVFRFDGANPLATTRSTTAADHVFIAPEQSLGFGRSIEVAADVNADGFMDLVVGDELFDGGRGRIVLFF